MKAVLLVRHQPLCRGLRLILKKSSSSFILCQLWFCPWPAIHSFRQKSQDSFLWKTHLELVRMVGAQRLPCFLQRASIIPVWWFRKVHFESFHFWQWRKCCRLRKHLTKESFPAFSAFCSNSWSSLKISWCFPGTNFPYRRIFFSWGGGSSSLALGWSFDFLNFVLFAWMALRNFLVLAWCVFNFEGDFFNFNYKSWI